MIAFMDAMIAQGNKRAPDPVCAASSMAYFDAYKAGGSQEATVTFFTKTTKNYDDFQMGLHMRSKSRKHKQNQLF